MFINNSNFLERDIPDFHPISQRYERIAYWREQKRRCMEGCWVSGKWMPGTLYYYVNFHKIKFEDDSGNSRAIGLPWLRDIEWDKAYVYEEACGFSGFELDDKFTCDRKYGPEKETALRYKRITQEEIDSKTYIPAREYLRKNHGRDLGKPLYANTAKNVIDLEARGGGKSYWASGLILHNFLFDSAFDYERYLQRKKDNNPMTSETVVGAIDAKFSNDLLSKVKVGLEHLPGRVELYNGGRLEVFYSPIGFESSGSLMPSRALTSPTKSSIIHRTFKDDPLAANGTRPNRAFLEEVGFMNNIIETWAALEATQETAKNKNLVIYGLGTGGLTTAGSALYTQEIYYNPEEYNCVAFEDVYENRGKIGYFLPKYLTLNEFKKGPNLETDVDLAKLYVEDERERARKSGNARTLQAKIINGPLVPSEIFLTLDDAFFPAIDLKERLVELEHDTKILESNYKVELALKSRNDVKWNFSRKPPIRDFPLKKGANTDACIEIFKQPIKNAKGEIEYGRYIAGTDPVDDDGGDAKNSLQSTFVMDSWTGEIVAEYTARPQFVETYYENVRRLLIYYRAVCNYEAQKKGLYGHFKNQNSLHLLCETPEILRDQELTKVQRIGNKKFGTTTNDRINYYARQLIYKWLFEEAYGKEGVLNMHTIKSPALLREMINWNPEINADRVSALGMLMILREDKAVYVHKQTVEQVKDLSADPFFNRHVNTTPKQDPFQEIIDNSQGSNYGDVFPYH